MESQKNDPATAERVAAAMDAGEDTPAPRWAPRAAEWTVQHELMAAFFDRLGHWLTQHANSQRPKGRPPIKPLSPFPRPVTAIDRARAAIDARAEAALDDLIDSAHALYEQENGG